MVARILKSDAQYTRFDIPSMTTRNSAVIMLPARMKSATRYPSGPMISECRDAQDAKREFQVPAFRDSR